MIIVRLLGGLGNQMFQYSFGYSLSRIRNEELCFDTSFYSAEWLAKNNRFTPQELGINHFCLDGFREITIPDKIEKKVSFLQRKNISRLLFLYSNPNINLGNQFRYIKETRLRDNARYIESLVWENAYFDGYWQCPSYFDRFRSELKRILVPSMLRKDVLSSAIQIKEEGFISVHIRRGDYLSNVPIYSKIRVLPLEFYRTAMKKAMEVTGLTKFLVFSNDVEWVKENLSFDNLSFINDFGHFSDIEEFYLMSFCRCNIISNSTFSWWSAYLNKNENRCVFAPNNCFGNIDMMCKNWVCLDTGF